MVQIPNEGDRKVHRKVLDVGSDPIPSYQVNFPAISP
jgi:hypothetical protein